MNDGFYIYTDHRIECFEIRDGLLYTHHIDRIMDRNQLKSRNKWIVKNPRKFGPISAAYDWFKTNYENG